MSEALQGEVVENGLIVKPAEAQVGAPSKFTLDIVGKLIAAFNNGYNVTEACYYSGISRDTYYDWLKTQPGFSDRMEEAKNALNRRAKEVIADAVNTGDVTTSKWLLERKDPEYRAKGELITDPNAEKVENKLKEFMDDTNDDAYPDASPGIDDVGTEPTATVEPEGGAEVAASPPDIS